MVYAFLIFFYAARLLLDIRTLICLHTILYNHMVRLSLVRVLDPLSYDTPGMGNVCGNIPYGKLLDYHTLEGISLASQ